MDILPTCQKLNSQPPALTFNLPPNPPPKTFFSMGFYAKFVANCLRKECRVFGLARSRPLLGVREFSVEKNPNDQIGNGLLGDQRVNVWEDGFDDSDANLGQERASNKREKKRTGNDEVKFFASCHPGLQSVLVKELESPLIGAYDINPGQAGVHFKGSSMSVGYAASYWLRTGIRVQALLAEGNLPVHIPAGDTIYDFTRQNVDWTELLLPSQTIGVRGHVWSCSNVSNSQLVVRRVRDAVCDSVRDAGYPRPPPPSGYAMPNLPLYVSLFQDKMTIYRDLCGDSLHRRGYRFMTHRAMLNEAAAAGILYLARWDKICHREGVCLVDPMCGSGTILIEAMLMAKNIPPGKFRKSWPFENWPDFDKQDWKKILQTAECEKQPWNGHLLGCDIHSKAAQMAKILTHRADAPGVIKIENTNCRHWLPEKPPDLVVTNPPWGIRLTDDNIVNGLSRSWEDLGAFLKRHCEGKEAFIMTGDREVTQHLKFRAGRRRKITVGGINCRLLRYEIYDAQPDDQSDIEPEATSTPLQEPHGLQPSKKRSHAKKQQRSGGDKGSTESVRPVYGKNVKDGSGGSRRGRLNSGCDDSLGDQDGVLDSGSGDFGVSQPPGKTEKPTRGQFLDKSGVEQRRRVIGAMDMFSSDSEDDQHHANASAG